MNNCVWCDEAHGPCDEHVEKADVIRLLREAHRANKTLSDRLAGAEAERDKAREALQRVLEATTKPSPEDAQGDLASVPRTRETDHMALELDDRVVCRTCGMTVWDADCVDGLCGSPHWTGDCWEQGCAVKYYAWVKSRMPRVLQPDGSLLEDGSVEATIDAWLEAGMPNSSLGPGR